MQNFLSRVRKPVQRLGSQHYLLYTLLSFALSVSLTRLFLELTGYPQLGGGGLHIAHVLWGGLLLFIAALIPLLFANRWALTLDAIIAGIGVGLFIDEVGKFITQTNDYFYPPAAPIIYAFFLMTVLLYLEFHRRKEHDVRTDLYAIFDEMEEVLDRDFSETERSQLLARLERLEQRTEDSDFRQLIKALHEFVSCDTLYLVPHRPVWWMRLWQQYKRIEARWVNKRGLQAAIAGTLVAVGAWALRYPAVSILSAVQPGGMQTILNDLRQAGLASSQVGLIWFMARLGLQAAVGVCLLVAAVFMALRKDRLGADLARLGLLLSLTMVNLIVFYFDQFSAIVTALVQFGLFLAITYYRHRYLIPKPPRLRHH